MGKSDLIPQTQPKRRVRPISNPLYFDDESFFCNVIRHHNLLPEEQFPALNRLYSVSIEHEPRFYLECQTFYAFTLKFMNLDGESTEDASSPCQFISRPKSYRKPAKYDIQPLPPIDESTESIEFIQEKWKNAGASAPVQMGVGYNTDECEDEQALSITSLLPSAMLSSNGITSFGLLLPTGPRLSPMSQMIQDLEYPSSSTNIDSCSIDPLGSIRDNEAETSITNINGIKSSDCRGIDAVNIHSISASPAIKRLHRVQLSSRFSNLIYDAQYDRYIKKPKVDMEGGSRPSVNPQFVGVYAAANRAKEKNGKAAGTMPVHLEAAIMKYTSSDRVAGVRPLRMKPQVQPSYLYRDIKNGLGNGYEEEFVKKDLRLASEPGRIGSPVGDQQLGRLRSDTIPTRKISRHPSANTSRKLGDSPTLNRQDSRRRKAAPIYFPATENENTIPRRPFTPVNRRSPSPRIRPVHSPPPMDRPYRHISQLCLNEIPRIGTPPAKDYGSDESNSPIVVDITSFVPPTAITTSPPDSITSPVPTATAIISPTIPERPIKLPSYTLDLPKIFSTPSPISSPPQIPSVTPATPTRNSNFDPNISPSSLSNQQPAAAKSSIYSTCTPKSSPHNSANIPLTISHVPSIPSPPNTPKTCLYRSNTVSTNPSSATQGTYSHSSNTTISTQASSITSHIASPSLKAPPFLKASPFIDASQPLKANPSLKPNPRLNANLPAIPSPNPRLSTLSQESIALTEHLVREGIYGGIVYDISKTSDPYPPHPNPPSIENPIPHLTQKLTSFQSRRRKKLEARKLNSALRKREKKEKLEEKAKEKKNRKTLRKVKAKTKKAKLAVQRKKGTVNYFQIRVFFRGLRKAVRMRLQGARRRLGEMQISRILGTRHERVWGWV
ncbi:fcda1856-1c92-45af-bff9-7094ab693f57 [Sclerotinia trifoliorum]|uniref:Fcda1856-1c92-45af-bff9-7094ab693f57 n=1 Tax=Sclerotinia trifoliorum TaxID=28548 RepID=A0A8H2VM20_9HELO|nr:fcda1856-1c92-45af-bff9-7094ab693f57 [Sclerotinia trifoliorum]